MSSFVHLIDHKCLNAERIPDIMASIQPSHTVLWERKTEDEVAETAAFLKRMHEIRFLHSLEWSGLYLATALAWQPLFDALSSNRITIEELVVWCRDGTVTFCQALFAALLNNTTVCSLRIIVTAQRDTGCVVMHRDLWTALNTLLCMRQSSLMLHVDFVIAYDLGESIKAEHVCFRMPTQSHLEQWPCVQHGGLVVYTVPTPSISGRPVNLWHLQMHGRLLAEAVDGPAWQALYQFLQYNSIRHLTMGKADVPLVNAIWANCKIQHLNGVDLFQTGLLPPFDETCLPQLRSYCQFVLPRRAIVALLHRPTIWPLLEHVRINNADLDWVAKLLCSTTRPLVSLELYIDEEQPFYVDHIKLFARALAQSTITHFRIITRHDSVYAYTETFMMQCLEHIFTKQTCPIRHLVLPRWYPDKLVMDQLCAIFARNKSLRVLHMGFPDPAPSMNSIMKRAFQHISNRYSQLLAANPRLLMAPGAMYNGDWAYYTPSVVQTIRQRQTCFILTRHAWQQYAFVCLFANMLRHHPLRNSLMAYGPQLTILLGGAMPLACELNEAYVDADRRQEQRRMWIIQTPQESSQLLQCYPPQLFDMLDSSYLDCMSGCLNKRKR